MPFEPGQTGNPNGRPKGTTQSARKIGKNKLRRLLKHLEPLADESIDVAAEIMQSPKASDATKLKAAVTLLEKYVAMVEAVYEEEKTPKASEEDSEEGEEEKEEEPRLRLTAPSK